MVKSTAPNFVGGMEDQLSRCLRVVSMPFVYKVCLQGLGKLHILLMLSRPRVTHYITIYFKSKAIDICTCISVFFLFEFILVGKIYVLFKVIVKGTLAYSTTALIYIQLWLEDLF